MERQADVEIDRQRDRQMVRQANVRQVHEQADGWMHTCMERQINGPLTQRQIGGQIGGKMDRKAKGLTKEQTDRQKDGYTDRHAYGLTDIEAD